MKLKSVALAVLLAALALPHTALAQDSELQLPGVTLRPGVTVDLSLTVRTNPARPRCTGPDVFVVHGLAHTAATWAPLVDTMFDDPALGRICRAVLLDLPGHGRSGTPTGLAFGDLALEDYVTAVTAALDGLPRGIRPRAIIGHSMGGMVVQMTQQRLLDAGTSLARRYGIVVAALLSTTRSREAPWAFADSGQAAQVVGSFVTVDPEVGTVVRIPPPVWVALFFSPPFADPADAQPVAGAPNPADLETLGWINDEAFAAGVELVGIPGTVQRPSVRQGAFAPARGTVLIMNGMSADPFAPIAEMQATYVHLTGDRSLRGFAAVTDPAAVHDLHVAQPRHFLDLLGDALAPLAP